MVKLSVKEVARQKGAWKSGIRDSLKSFERCRILDFPLHPGITNKEIAKKEYGKSVGVCANESHGYPDYL